jgi:hypothetical protein
MNRKVGGNKWTAEIVCIAFVLGGASSSGEYEISILAVWFSYRVNGHSDPHVAQLLQSRQQSQTAR